MPGFHPGIQFDFEADKVNCFFGPNACLADETLIATTLGPKRIDELTLDDIVYDEFGQPIRILNIFNNGVKEVVQLTNRHSLLVECTEDHIWLCKERRKSEYSQLPVKSFFKRTDIKRIYLSPKLGDVDVPYSYSIGAILGDGCSRQRTKNIHISSASPAIVEKIALELGGTCRKLTGNNYTWSIENMNRPELYDNWCKDRYAHEKIVDLKILKTWNRLTLLRFVAGLIDTDGSVCKEKATNIVVQIGMQAISVIDALEYAFLALWGIKMFRSIDNRSKYKNGPVHCLKVSNNVESLRILNELNEFLVVESKKYLSKYDNDEYQSKRTKNGSISIKLGSRRYVNTYDIHVDSETNLYCLANGLVTHNSGKSTIMKMIKSYCGIEKGGWSKISSELALGAQCQSHFPWVYRAYSPATSDCVVDWDGIASFYNDGDIKIDEWAWFSNNISLSEDGMTSESEQFQYLMDKPSSGQYRMIKINKLLNMAKNPPDLTMYISENPTQRAESDYIRTLPRNGKPTLILDEPERALSLPKQMELFKLLNELTSEYQIIIATHSPFVLFQQDMKIFNIEEGYSDKCLDIFKRCVEK